MTLGTRPRIYVLGAGFGGLEAAFYLRMRLHDAADITLLSDKPYFLFKPNTIYVPFGLDPEHLKIDLRKPTERKDIRFLQARVSDLDPDTRTIVTNRGEKYHYDYLIIATGAAMRPQEIAGLDEHAHSIWTPEDMLRLRAALGDLLEAAAGGRHQRVLFLLPPGCAYPNPLYEIALMLDTWLRKNQARGSERSSGRGSVSLTWTTHEPSYMQAFGARVSETLSREFNRREIIHHPDYVVDKVEDGVVYYRSGAVLAYDLLVTLPPYVAAAPFAALPADARGFITSESAAGQVVGYPNIYVAGDASDFPIKQAFLAFLQADAIAEHLAAQILGGAPAFAFEPVSLYVMEEYNRALFAQVPLRVSDTGTFELNPDSPLYRTGVSPLWRLGKQILGVYLPWRFSAGEPFHAGLPWKGVAAAFDLMSGVLAHGA